MRDAELIQDARDDEVDQVGDRLRPVVEPRHGGTIAAPARASFSMFSRWIAESGVSRGTSTSGRRSFSITSAARSIRLSARPPAIAPSVPIVHGQIAIASAALEPEATGAIQSSCPKTASRPSRAPKRAASARAASRGCAGNTRSHSCFATICAAGE